MLKLLTFSVQSKFLARPEGDTKSIYNCKVLASIDPETYPPRPCFMFKSFERLTDMAHEIEAYKLLAPIQGKFVPEYFGTGTCIDDKDQMHHGICLKIVTGVPLWWHENKSPPNTYTTNYLWQGWSMWLRTSRRLNEITKLGVNHGNLQANHILWDKDRHWIWFLDFSKWTLITAPELNQLSADYPKPPSKDETRLWELLSDLDWVF